MKPEIMSERQATLIGALLVAIGSMSMSLYTPGDADAGRRLRHLGRHHKAVADALFRRLRAGSARRRAALRRLWPPPGGAPVPRGLSRREHRRDDRAYGRVASHRPALPGHRRFGGDCGLARHRPRPLHRPAIRPHHERHRADHGGGAGGIADDRRHHSRVPRLACDLRLHGGVWRRPHGADRDDDAGDARRPRSVALPAEAALRQLRLDRSPPALPAAGDRHRLHHRHALRFGDHAALRADRQGRPDAGRLRHRHAGPVGVLYFRFLRHPPAARPCPGPVTGALWHRLCGRRRCPARRAPRMPSRPISTSWGRSD